MNFERGQSPKSSMGVGRIHQINQWMEQLAEEFYPGKRRNNISWGWEINPDFTINIFCKKNQGVFDISIDTYSELPEFIKFNIIDGDFACNFFSKESLKCFPKIIKGYAEFYGRNFRREFTKEDIESICKIEGGIYFH